MALILVLQGSFYSGFTYLQHCIQHYRLQQLSLFITNELSAMQLRALEVNANSQVYRMVLLSDGDGYSLTKGILICKKVKLSQLGWGEFRMTGASSIQFQAGGAPQAYTCITLVARNDVNIRKLIEVQPVTGRIVVTDG